MEDVTAAPPRARREPLVDAGVQNRHIAELSSRRRGAREQLRGSATTPAPEAFGQGIARAGDARLSLPPRSWRSSGGEVLEVQAPWQPRSIGAPSAPLIHYREQMVQVTEAVIAELHELGVADPVDILQGHYRLPKQTARSVPFADDLAALNERARR